MVLELGLVRDHEFASCLCNLHVCFLFGICFSQLDINQNSVCFSTYRYGTIFEEVS